jgi:hypothetical protein
MPVAQQSETSPIENYPLLQNQTPPSRPLDHPTGHDRFRKIFLDHWERYCNLRLTDEVPAISKLTSGTLFSV